MCSYSDPKLLYLSEDTFGTDSSYSFPPCSFSKIPWLIHSSLMRVLVWTSAGRLWGWMVAPLTNCLPCFWPGCQVRQTLLWGFSVRFAGFLPMSVGLLCRHCEWKVPRPTLLSSGLVWVWTVKETCYCVGLDYSTTPACVLGPGYLTTLDYELGPDHPTTPHWK